ncbi:unnamed protein product [Zymoseptoria tritici ST99CH_1A5]|uniref:F-box domain-containing protein n=2 Tax=Zymoseptoria tritici TaxID=1047171 RepID=A0A1X7RMP6_ZYMT9|nr:unnamed protein product [Zymoseptoria tritici ST99CH_3D7]SMY22382.1 unnamed protein product [Zymoseptoria tritici ST99CH_1A5]
MSRSPQPDEGYHGDAASLPESDASATAPSESYIDPRSAIAKLSTPELKVLLLDMPLPDRIELVRTLCHSFKAPTLLDLHKEIASMVYHDPVFVLPNELMLDIFSHLTPRELLIASQVSKPWRERTHDERLWRNCFYREGWIVDKSKMAGSEELAKRKGARVAERVMRTAKPGGGLTRKSSRKRPRDEAFSEPEPARTTDTGGHMEGVESTSGSTLATNGSPCGKGAPSEMESDSDSMLDDPSFNPADVKITPTVFSAAREPKVSWSYLYKQRRRLEKNWETGTYKMFRLPHPQHLEEGHTECVYAIQHRGNHLVSGSRDLSIRIWDLNTCRLLRDPLLGHEASVLCLQFDDAPGDKHDVIISGGSDNLVLVWRFSTGQVLKKFYAHTESVLNLRFDDRYLVTCSKDKSIKIWNRHDIEVHDDIVPKRVISQLTPNLGADMQLSSYTLLDTFTGHQAAVNAVQIHGDIIVSASGDRTIKSWDIHAGGHRKQYSGHTKGIACVQFDGRRIVSGSSDNTVRIFDYETTAEVACLDGHSSLVRTVQARFGDLDITTDEELLAESQEADRNFVKSLKQGMTPRSLGRSGTRRNAGSSRPEEMLSFGTKIPPGGGGSKWARIVSGSYDETVIIWKRGKDGKWRPNFRLQQGAHLGPTHRRVAPVAAPQPAPSHPQQLAAIQNAQAVVQTTMTNLIGAHTALHGPGHQPTGPAPNQATVATIQNSLGSQLHNLAQLQYQQQQAGPHAVQQGDQAGPSSAAASSSRPLNTAAPAAPAHAQAQIAATAPVPAPHTVHRATTAIEAGPNATAAPTAAPAQPQPNAPHQNAHAHAHAHAHHHHHHAPARETNRVFKLQFDARRIVSCSQNKVVVGWDFAAGDRDLEWIGDWSVETA